MTRLLVATTNAGKLRDFAAAFDVGVSQPNMEVDTDVVHRSVGRDRSISSGGVRGKLELVSLPGLREIAAPAEDEDSFSGNARVKAIYYSQFAPGELVLADDSGLEVDALNGAPGVRSARYAEDSSFAGDAGMSMDERNNACLIEALLGVADEKRTGRYRCVLVAARDGVVVAEGDGTVEGKIIQSARGEGGFGYDPYFVSEGESGTMAELDSATRMKLSHRGRALRNLLEKI